MTEHNGVFVPAYAADVSSPLYELGNLFWTVPQGAVSDENIKLKPVDNV
jgi:hypothetical protein